MSLPGVSEKLLILESLDIRLSLEDSFYWQKESRREPTMGNKMTSHNLEFALNSTQSY